MSKIRLSMPVAFLIENCRTSGKSDEYLIQSMKHRDFSLLQHLVVEQTMNFIERLDIAEEIGDDWERAIREGYEFKHLHINGMKKLLNFRYHKQPNVDYVQTEQTIHRVTFNRSELEVLHSLINKQWDIVEEKYDTASHVPLYKIELKHKK